MNFKASTNLFHKSMISRGQSYIHWESLIILIDNSGSAVCAKKRVLHTTEL